MRDTVQEILNQFNLRTFLYPQDRVGILFVSTCDTMRKVLAHYIHLYPRAQHKREQGIVSVYTEI